VYREGVAPPSRLVLIVPVTVCEVVTFGLAHDGGENSEGRSEDGNAKVRPFTPATETGASVDTQNRPMIDT
jgi:hypothetical protein